MRDSWVNSIALTLALGAATWGAAKSFKAVEPVGSGGERAPVERAYAKSLEDARKQVVKTGAYSRIVSLDPEVSRMLLSLVEPSRLLAISSYAKKAHPWGYRFGEVATIEKSSQIDKIAALEPDLVFVTPLSDAATLARLRELGIAVFDAGGARGIEQSLAQVETLGELLHLRPRALQLKESWEQRLRGLEAQLDKASKVPGIYLTRYGDKLYGGTQGTSFADLLRLAGVEDLAAAKGYRQWPSYSVEELWELDPPLIVTRQGQAALICQHPELAKLRACGPKGRVVEVIPGLEGDSGAGLLSAAGELFARLHGS